MKGRLLAALALCVAITSLTRADYVLIIANLNARNDAGGTDGGFGFPPGMGGRGMGMGMPSGGAGPGGAAGMTPAGLGGPPSGGTAPLGGLGGGPPRGMGMGMGAGPGGMMGGVGGLMGGMMGGLGAVDQADDSHYIVVTVLEVGDIGSKLKNFESGAFERQGGMPFNHRWGGRATLKHKTPMYEVVPLKNNSGQLLQSATRRFAQRLEKLGAGASTEDKLTLARWGLENGLLAEFTKLMDGLASAEESRNDPFVKAYVKTKADLDRPAAKDDVVSAWRTKVLENYRVAEGPHYALLHNHAQGEGAEEVKHTLDRLEKTMRSYYYWWALRGQPLPVPTARQVVVLSDKIEDFRRLQKHLTASPLLADSFFARREGLSVFAGRRTDDAYTTLDRMAKPYWEKGYVRNELLRGSLKAGVPKAMLPRLQMTGGHNEEVDTARVFALLLRAMEEEWDATGLSHEASRQLVYASGLLPRNVHAPEWLMFGLGSFFEVPLQSPFGGAGAPSPYWMPRFREYYNAKQYNRGRATAANPSSYDALVQTVTEGGFRSKPERATPQPDETPEMATHRAKESHARRARAAAWSLTFFLAKMELDGLRRYFKELSRMPRDVELDDKVLLACFARSFDCVNADKSLNKAKLTNLADRWIKYVQSTPLEAEAVHRKIREYYKQVSSVPPPGTGNPPAGPAGLAPPGAGGRGIGPGS
ncbi:MAG: DUF1570 domain-containing protein [Gemmataceae bacterium]